MTTTSASSELQHLLTIPPSNLDVQYHNNNNPITIAHAVLQKLRDEGDEKFLFLRTIIELTSSQHLLSNNNEELIFHCITGCRQIILWNWKEKYSIQFINHIRDYFMILGQQLACNNNNISRTCSLACYTASVSFWKRGWNDDNDTSTIKEPTPQEQSLIHNMGNINGISVIRLHSKQDLFQYIESLFQQHNQNQQSNIRHGALFLNCMISEFVGRSAVNYRMPLEFHKIAHRSFEKDGPLQHSLQLAVNVFSHIVNTITTTNAFTMSNEFVQQSSAVVQLVSDIIGWEFGIIAWDTGSLGASMTVRTLIRPPYEWKDLLGRTEFGQAVFRIHDIIVSNTNNNNNNYNDLAHNLRQLLLQLASLSGPILAQPDERKHYVTFFCEGTLQLLQKATNPVLKPDTTELLDTLQLISRLISNFKLSTLIDLPTFVPLLQGFAITGKQLLIEQTNDCEAAGGDIDSMEYNDWREESLALLIECSALLCDDPWLLHTGTEESRKIARQSLSTVLGPVYEGFVHCRTRMAALEEHYYMINETELDEIREEIIEKGLEEEMESVAAIGRLHLSAAIACLSTAFSNTMPRLQPFWDTTGDVTPEASALLEESRLLVMYVCHLLTDNNEGESPSIPDAVMVACRDNGQLAGELSAAVQALFQFANSQAQKIAQNPTNRRLSPLLAKTFLWFLDRWAPAYLYTENFSTSDAENNTLVQEWSNPDNVNNSINLCISLCLNYQCYWPQEPPIQESAAQLLHSLSRRGGKVRSAMVASPFFQNMVQYHCLTAGLRHNIEQSEFESTIRTKTGGNVDINMVWGYQRLPYQDKARYLTVILTACSDDTDERANTMITESLKALHESFTSLVVALQTKQINSDDINARETASLCVELFCGVVSAAEMSKPERIPQFVSTYLVQLSGLMTYYAQDLSICETLLRFFRDYTANFIVFLDGDQSLMLFQACADLLKSYSAIHCSSRVIRKKSSAEADAEEEQAYTDILTAIQLLINLGAKDFIDACGSQAGGLNPNQVTDMIFFGLQQILPLMTQGLLQYPTLCSQFFDLVGFMMDTYAEKVAVLPIELFEALLDSLLFGMSHHDAEVSKCSLQGLASIAKEQLTNKTLTQHLDQRPDLFDRCTRRLLSDVVFRTVVVDRVEAAGMALLPLAAVDLNRFAAVVQELCVHVPDIQQRSRLEAAFTKLIQPEVILKAGADGYEGRLNRVNFKRSFESFVNEIHAFLVLQ